MLWIIPSFRVKSNIFLSASLYSFKKEFIWFCSCSVYNGSGGVDTKGVDFDIVDSIGYGDDFYAFIINMNSWEHLTNDGNNVILRAEIPVL